MVDKCERCVALEGYIDWLNKASSGAYTMAWIHGHRDSDELVEEGKHLRSELGLNNGKG